MNIIILGAGKVGYNLARQLIHENKHVTIIEKDLLKVKQISNQLDCMVINDEGNNLEALKHAGIEKADYFISVTDSDEVNMIACGLASSASKSVITIATVRHIDYSQAKLTKRAVMGIDHIINPEIEASKVIVRSIENGAMSSITLFDNSDLQMRSISVQQGSPLIGQSLQEFAKTIETNFLVPIVLRNDNYLIPSGNLVFEENDLLYVFAEESSFEGLFGVFGKPKITLNNVAILGGGKLASYIADLLQPDNVEGIGFINKLVHKFIKHKHKNLKIIESDYNRCKVLTERYPEATIIHSDITDENLWEDDTLKNYDLVITATGNAELNLIVAMYAKKNRIPRAISLVETQAYQHIAEDLGIDICISINNVLVNRILKLIRKGNIKSIYNISGSPFEVIEFEIHGDSPLCNKQIKNIKMPKDTLVLLISRGESTIIPRGDLKILLNDHVVVISHSASVNKLEAVFEGK